MPTLIHHVSYVEAKGSNVNNGVWSNTMQYKLRIPIMAVVQDNRIYLPQSHYINLTDEEIQNYWTIQLGDLIIKTQNQIKKSPTYEDELITFIKHQGLTIIKITDFADNTSGNNLYTKHWRIGGK